MCSFATRNAAEFSDALLRFVAAQAGLIAPQRGRTNFNLSVSASQVVETRAAAGSPGSTPPAAATVFYNLDACFEMVTPLTLPDRIAPIARPA